MNEDRARSYLDERPQEETVEVRFIDGERPTEVWRATFIDPQWEAQWPAEQLMVALYSEDYPPSNALTVKRSYINWGASGIVETILLDVASGVIGELVLASLMGAFRRIRTAGKDEAEPTEPLDREPAREQARQRIILSFGLDDDAALEVLTEEHRLDDGEWMFVFQGDGVRYDATVLDERGSASVVTVKRSESD